MLYISFSISHSIRVCVSSCKICSFWKFKAFPHWNYVYNWILCGNDSISAKNFISNEIKTMKIKRRWNFLIYIACAIAQNRRRKTNLYVHPSEYYTDRKSYPNVMTVFVHDAFAWLFRFFCTCFCFCYCYSTHNLFQSGFQLGIRAYLASKGNISAISFSLRPSLTPALLYERNTNWILFVLIFYQKLKQTV